MIIDSRDHEPIVCLHWREERHVLQTMRIGVVMQKVRLMYRHGWAYSSNDTKREALVATIFLAPYIIYLQGGSLVCDLVLRTDEFALRRGLVSFVACGE